MAKFALILKTAAIIAFLLLVKLAVPYLNLDTISASPVITALIAGVIFTIAIIDDDIHRLGQEGAAPPLAVKMR